MDRFFGFDLGDAESAVSRLDKGEGHVPEMLSLCGAKSFITAYAVRQNGELLIGEQACYSADAVRRKIRFKSRFLTDPESAGHVKRFAAGVLGELYGSGELVKNEDCCFYIGCPAGWDRNAREEYREIFERVGYPPAKIVSESRGAMVSACQSRHLQVGYDILSKPVLVVDIGSSTTDFAYICGGREVEMQTAGEVSLGGGIMDEILLEEAVRSSEEPEAIREVFRNSEPWQSYCEFGARRLKEKYFSDEDYWRENPCTESILIRSGRPLRLKLSMDPTMADRLLNQKVERLDNRSFKEVFLKSLEDVRAHISGEQPELLFLTGGVSKLPAIKGYCRSVFPESVVITGTEPEFSVSKGLAYCGRIDEELREFREELEQLKNSSSVENIVAARINDLYHSVVDALVEPILNKAALPVFERWRDGEIRRLTDADPELQREIEAFLHTDEAREILMRPIAAWLKPVSDALEEYTVPICVKHHVPYTALSLSSYLSASDIDIKIDAKNVFPVEELTWLIDSIITLIVSLLCGGSGLALISSGPTGLIAGATVSILVLVMGKTKMEQALLAADIPKPVRKLVPRGAFRNRMDSMSSTIKTGFYESLEGEKNEAITERLVEEISGQIEQCLTRMAEVVEIPLG